MDRCHSSYSWSAHKSLCHECLALALTLPPLGSACTPPQIAPPFLAPLYALGSHASGLAVGGFLSPTSRLDAGALGHGPCSAYNGSVTITVTTMVDNDDNRRQG